MDWRPVNWKVRLLSIILAVIAIAALAVVLIYWHVSQKKLYQSTATYTKIGSIEASMLVHRRYDESIGFTNFYADGSRIFTEDGTILPKDAYPLKELLNFSLSAKAAETFDRFEGSAVIKPDSLGRTDVSVYMPYNYAASLTASSEYVATCIADGFVLQSMEHTSSSVELSLKKQLTILRVVIYESNLKIYAKGLEKESWR